MASKDRPKIRALSVPFLGTCTLHDGRVFLAIPRDVGSILFKMFVRVAFLLGAATLKVASRFARAAAFLLHTWTLSPAISRRALLHCSIDLTILSCGPPTKIGWVGLLAISCWAQVQYFVTKDTEEFSQFTEPVACRGYTLPRDESLTEPKGWTRGNTKIGPVLEVTTCCLQGKY